MKNIDTYEIEELLTIIPRGYPSMDIFHLSEGYTTLSKQIDQLCKTEGYCYDLFITDEKEFENITASTRLKAHKFDFKRNRYNRHSRLYDFLFITINLDEIEDIETFYKKLYPISKNGGTLIFILDNEYDIRAFEERLIEKNYVAVNQITDTFKNYKIISAQKMHGWGN